MSDMPWLRLPQETVPHNPHALRLWEEGGERECCEAFCLRVDMPSIILDVGAGYGHATRFMAGVFPAAHVYALDYESYATPGVEEYPGLFIQADAHEIPQSDGSFDAVWAAHVLEHLQSPLDALWEWRRVLSGAGAILGVVVPSQGEVVPGHLWDFSDPKRLYYMLRLTGFGVLEVVRKAYSLCAMAYPCEAPQSVVPADLGVPESVEVRELV